MTCHKEKFTRIGAALALASNKKRRNSWKRKENRFYKCEECGYYHLTSQKKGF